MVRRIMGLDFSSSPSKRKPMKLAVAQLDDDVLTVDELVPVESLEGFNVLLELKEQAVFGLDLPFGLPAVFVTWAYPQVTTWTEVIQELPEDLGEFVGLVQSYGRAQPDGHKRPLRVTDQLASAVSPLNTVRPPVGRMFFRAAAPLLKSEANIPVLRPTASKISVVEAYPSLVQRSLCHGSKWKYKGDVQGEATYQQKLLREEIVSRLQLPSQTYGFRVLAKPSLWRECLEDPHGDALDSVMCAVQAGWASRQDLSLHPKLLGAELEGCIMDPLVFHKQ